MYHTPYYTICDIARNAEINNETELLYCNAGERKNGFNILPSHKILYKTIQSYQKLCNPW
jgi:hypothetical protein